MPKPSSNVVPINDRIARIYRQIDRLLDDLESTTAIPFKERIAALYTMARIHIAFNNLRKGQGDGTGSAVRKYASAFQAKNAAGRGKASSRSIARDLDLEPDDDDGDPAVA